MAEIPTSTRRDKKPRGVKRIRKASTRIDLTPMVDLGFLLITFFIFSITMSQPTTMNLSMPKDTTDPGKFMDVPESGALTFVLANSEQLGYYFGIDPQSMTTITYDDVRSIILAKKKATPADKLFLIIKPGRDASWKNTVEVLDEMQINDIARYAMVDARPDEIALIK